MHVLFLRALHQAGISPKLSTEKQSQKHRSKVKRPTKVLDWHDLEAEFFGQAWARKSGGREIKERSGAAPPLPPVVLLLPSLSAATTGQPLAIKARSLSGTNSTVALQNLRRMRTRSIASPS
jgi:hypothetical protein